MSEAIKNVLIIGASGNLGPSILSALDADPHFTVSVLSRQSSKSTFPSHIKVHTVADSYPENELVEAFKGQDAIIATTPATTPQKVFINAAIKAGVKRFLPSEFGGYPRDPRALAIAPAFQSKNDIVDYLKSQESTGLSWTALITGSFIDWGIKVGFLGQNLSAYKAIIYGSGNTRFSTTTLSTVGTAIAKILRNPEKTANQYLFISSFETTGNEILTELEKATGKKWDVEHKTIEETINTGKEKMSKHDYSGIVELILGVIFGEDQGNDLTQEHELANKLLNLPEETLETVIAKILKD